MVEHEISDASTPLRQDEEDDGVAAAAPDDATSALITTSLASAAQTGFDVEQPPDIVTVPIAERAERLREGIQALRAWHAANMAEHMAVLDDQATDTVLGWTCCLCDHDNAATSEWCESCSTSREIALLPGRRNRMAGLDSFEMFGEDFLDPQGMAWESRSQHSRSNALLLMALFAGCLCGSCWGLLFGGRTHMMDGAFLGMSLSVIFACVSLYVLSRRRALASQRQLQLPLATLQMSLRAAGAPASTTDITDTSAAAPFLDVEDQSGAEIPDGDAALTLNGDAARTFDLVNFEMDTLLGMLGANIGLPGSASNPGADTGVIAALPTRVLSAEDVDTSPSEMQVCTICIENFAEGDEEKTLPCFHRFHAGCIDQWLQRSVRCPVCKNRVDDPQE